MHHVILEERDGYETIKRPIVTESYSYWSCDKPLVRFMRIPIDFVFWIVEFIKLHQSKYEFEINVWKNNRSE